MKLTKDEYKQIGLAVLVIAIYLIGSAIVPY